MPLMHFLGGPQDGGVLEMPAECMGPTYRFPICPPLTTIASAAEPTAETLLRTRTHTYVLTGATVFAIPREYLYRYRGVEER